MLTLSLAGAHTHSFLFSAFWKKKWQLNPKVRVFVSCHSYEVKKTWDFVSLMKPASTTAMPAVCYPTLFHRPASPISRVRVFSFSKPSLLSTRTSRLINSPIKSSTLKWRVYCFKNKDSSSEFVEHDDAVVDRLSQKALNPEFEQPRTQKDDWWTKLRKASDAVFKAERWTVPWSATTILQVMILWIASFWLVGSWIIPFLAHTAGFPKESLTYRGQALYSLLTDVAEGVAGIAILHRCLARFQPLPSDWFKVKLEVNWLLEVSLGCLMFPVINHLSQVNLNLLPIIPSTPVAVSSVEQSIVARDPVAMVLYAIVVSVCAPVWEEIVFRGFLLPSLTRYMPVWCSIIVSAIAFALAHFNVQKLLPLVFLGIVMGSVFARSRNLLASMLLHSLWNAFVFHDLMK